MITTVTVVLFFAGSRSYPLILHGQAFLVSCIGLCVGRGITGGLGGPAFYSNSNDGVFLLLHV